MQPMRATRRRVREFSEKAGAVVRKHHPDYTIITYVSVLVMIGLITMFAIGPQRANFLNEASGSELSDTYFIIKQAVSVLLAVGTFIVFGLVLKFDFLQKHALKIFGLGLAACALLFVAGNVAHSSLALCALGACRWFQVPGLGTFQPAELLKLGVLIYLAGFLAIRMRNKEIDSVDRTLIPVAIILAISALFVIILQKDLGTGIALFSIVAAMFIASGMSKKIGLVMLGVAAVAGMLFIFTAEHRVSRVMTFLQGDSTSVDDEAGYQITNAKIAIGSGGVTGLGIGNSVQAAGYLPEAINDSVFAILGETFGFAGLVFILAMFYLLLVRILKIMDNLEDERYKLIAAGVFGWIGSHVIINIAAMTGMMPLTGITLPFLSFGGTSMIFIAAALGMVFQVSQYTSHRSLTKESGYENSRSRRGVGRTRYAGRRGY